MFDSLWHHGLQPTRLPCLSQPPRVCSNSCPWADDAIQPSHPLSSSSPPAFNLSQPQGLFQWVSSSHQVAKALELQLQHQSFQWIFRAISFRIDWFDLSCRPMQIKTQTGRGFLQMRQVEVDGWWLRRIRLERGRAHRDTSGCYDRTHWLQRLGRTLSQSMSHRISRA